MGNGQRDFNKVWLIEHWMMQWTHEWNVKIKIEFFTKKKNTREKQDKLDQIKNFAKFIILTQQQKTTKFYIHRCHNYVVHHNSNILCFTSDEKEFLFLLLLRHISSVYIPICYLERTWNLKPGQKADEMSRIENKKRKDESRSNC